MLANFYEYFASRSNKRQPTSFPHREVPNEITLLFIYKLAEQANDQNELIKELFNTSLVFSGHLKKDPFVTIKSVSSYISSFIEDGLIHYWNLGKPVAAHKNLESLFFQKGTRIRQLTLNQISESLSILKTCSNLNSLKIRGCFDEISLKVLADYKCATKLQKLKITSYLLLNEDCLQSLIKITALKALRLKHAGVRIDLSKLKCLPVKRLSLSSCDIDDQENLNGLGSLTSLRKLKLGSIPNKTFICFFPNLALSHLRLITLTNFEPATVTVLKDSSTLRTLDLGETNISHASLEALCEHPTLEILRLSKNPFIKPDIIKAIKASNLKRVGFKNCLHIHKNRFTDFTFDYEEKEKGHLELIRKKKD